MKNIITDCPASNSLVPDSQPLQISSFLSSGDRIERTLSILKRKLVAAFEGRVESGLYVQAADCGTGKSTAAQAAIREWKDRGFPGRGGIIVAVSTRAEIDAYIGGMGLSTLDYAVMTANQSYNAYGRGRDRAGEAQLLFTTQEQLRRRLAEAGSFACAATTTMAG